MNTYNIIKSLHIIFMVSWFAGLFYIVRLFIYHVEAKSKTKDEFEILGAQFKIMEKKLWYIITWPAMVLTVVFGVWMLVTPIGMAWLKTGWMHVKLLFVVVLIIYHLATHKMFLKLQKNVLPASSVKLRFWNEGATLLLVSIVFIVVMKNALNWGYGVIVFFALGMLLMLAVKWYKKIRSSKE